MIINAIMANCSIYRVINYSQLKYCRSLFLNVKSTFNVRSNLLSTNNGTDQKHDLFKYNQEINDSQAFFQESLISQVEFKNSMPLKSIKPKSEYKRNHEFIDYRKVVVKGGKGGDGMICFLHLRCNPMAGPSGGDGGNGGHVIFEASKNVRSLNRIKSYYSGLPGVNGMHKDMTGKNAEHLILNVPIGTLIKNANTGKLVADMDQEGMKFLAAKGGSGGKGNHYFLNNNNRHPRVAEIGAKGEENKWILELKVIAQAGLVGFPNAGKSTLLSAVSRAKPKVASYPFTTMKPTVGIVQYDDSEQLAIADLPGIIQDAHKNRGLGLDFLKHVERCICLFYVIDISVNDSYEQLRILMHELDQYDKDLSKRPMAIVVNKIDVDGSENKLKSLMESMKMDNLEHLPVIPVSAKYGTNLTKFLIYFRQLFDRHQYKNNSQDIL